MKLTLARQIALQRKDITQVKACALPGFRSMRGFAGVRNGVTVYAHSYDLSVWWTLPQHGKCEVFTVNNAILKAR